VAPSFSAPSFDNIRARSLSTVYFATVDDHDDVVVAVTSSDLVVLICFVAGDDDAPVHQHAWGRVGTGVAFNQYGLLRLSKLTQPSGKHPLRLPVFSRRLTERSHRHQDPARE
jgi:hypothetical protein